LKIEEIEIPKIAWEKLLIIVKGRSNKDGKVIIKVEI